MRESDSMSKSLPRVSIVLPVYNGASYVDEAIESIRSQSLVDWELIVVDDGSEDDSMEQCRRHAEDDERIKLFSNGVNLGLARTMNRGVRLCRADYIAVQEQDDISTPNRLRLEASILDAHPSVGVVSGVAEWIEGDGEVIRRFPGLLERGGQYPSSKREMVRYLYLEGCKVVNAGCMFRREVIAADRAPFLEDAKHAIDWRFFLETAHEWAFYGVRETVVLMRRGRHHDHLTKRKPLLFNESRRCLREIYWKYRNHPSSPVTLYLYYAALSNQLIREGRFYGGPYGAALLSHAILCNPVNKEAWRSLFELSTRRMWRTVLALSGQRG